MARKKKISEIEPETKAELDTKETKEIAKASTEASYVGSVNYSLLFNGSPRGVQIHNSGTSELQKAFAMLMSGNVDSAKSYIPKYIDIYGPIPEGTGEEDQSWLYKRIVITGAKYENKTDGYVATLNGVIDYSNLKYTGEEAATISTVEMLLLPSETAAASKAIAKIRLTPKETLSLITQNVAGLITWTMKLKISN